MPPLQLNHPPLLPPSLLSTSSGDDSDDADDRKYDELSVAVDSGDLNAVRRLVEGHGLDPNGDPHGSGWGDPLLRCTDRRVARYLHLKGSRGYGYGLAAAVQSSDLERIQELVASGEVDFDAAKASRLIGSSKSADVVRWLFDRAGDDSNREGTYHITKAYKIGDLERIRTLAAAPGFGVNRGWLLPMPGCGDDVVPYTTEDERSKLNEQMATTYWRVSSTRCTMLVYPLESALFHQDPFQPEVATYLIEELSSSTEISLRQGPLGERGRGGGAMHSERGVGQRHGDVAVSPWQRRQGQVLRPGV